MADVNELQELQRLQSHKYNIVLCELYNKNIHGKTNQDNVYGHYLCMHVSRTKSILEPYDEEFEECDDEDNYEPHVYHAQTMHSDFYKDYCLENIKPHNIIRNYNNIISKPDYIQPQIAEVIYLLPEGQCVAIIKTLWIKLVQRAWKRVFQARQNIIRMRLNINSIRYREMHGDWPYNCRYFPSINGMFWN